MKLLLSRHGNTFGPSDPVVWAGATNDLPLVEKGLEQARIFAQRLLAEKIAPRAIYCSSLLRTKVYAQILVETLQLNMAPIIDPRIHEIDYGQWTGLTNDEVALRFGKDALDNWDEKSIWPSVGAWGGSPGEAEEEARSFIKDLSAKYGPTDTVVVVTSNGRLRFFLSLVPDEYKRRIESGAFKVKTGNICKLVWKEDRLETHYWNEDPRKVVAL